jgi:hypothetical protein
MSAAQTSHEWFDYICALTPSVVALLVAYIAYRQWRIAQGKLRLDLYNKRFAIFEATLQLYQELVRCSEETKLESIQTKFITAMIESEFLFASSPDIKNMMQRLHKSAGHIKGHRQVMKETGMPSDNVIEASNQLQRELGALDDTLEAIKESMSPYLSFKGLAM